MQQVSNCQYIFGNCAANNELTEEIQQHQDLQKPQLMGFQDEYLSESTNVFEQQLNLFEEYVNEQLFSGKINVKTIPADDNQQQILDLIQPKIEEKAAEQEWNNELNGVGFNQSIFQNNFYNSNQQNVLISTFQNGHDNNFQFQISQFNFQNENFFLNECPQPKFENPSLFYQENQFLNLPIPQQSNSQNCQIINNNQSQPQQYQQTQQQQPQQYQQTQQYQQQQAQQSLQIQQQQQPQQYQQAQLQFEQVQQKNYQYLQQDLQQNNFQQEITFNQFQPAPPKQEINNAIFETKLETNSDDGQETEQNSQEKQTSQDCQQKSSQQNKKYLFDNNSNKLKNFYKTILKPLIESLKKVYQQQNRDDVIEFIKIAFPISCNQKHFLLLFPHLQEICNMQKKTTIVQEFEQKLNFNQEQLQILSEIRKQAARLFSKKFYYFTRIFKSHAASKNIEEFYYGCLFYSERQHQEQYTPEGSNYMKPERILNPVQSNLRQRLYQIQSSKLQQQYNQNQNIQQIQQRIIFY